MLLIHAKNITDNIIGSLKPYCDIINEAGSVRRKVEEPGDIEIVCIPRITVKEERDLFGDITRTTKEVHPEFQRIVKGLGKVIKGQPSGRYMQIETPEIIIDLFMPQPNDYWRQYAIRTGSAEYARRYIANQWVKNGWRGTTEGLRRQKECSELNGKWFVQKEFSLKPTLPPVWDSEEHFFRWLGVQYVAPQYRNL